MISLVPTPSGTEQDNLCPPHMLLCGVAFLPEAVEAFPVGGTKADLDPGAKHAGLAQLPIPGIRKGLYRKILSTTLRDRYSSVREQSAPPR